MKVEISLGDTKVREYLNYARRRAGNMSPAMRKIAFLGESGIEDAFHTQTAPDGSTWKPSQRVEKKGGKTMTDTGNLRRSASSRVDRNRAIWGMNAIYAAIHQFGGLIMSKSGRITGNYVQVRSVLIPARKMLPESLAQMDRDTIIAILKDHVSTG